MNKASIAIGKEKGFTVIELMLAILIAAILFAVAIPDFTTLTKNKRITAQSNEFLTSLALARSEALKRVSRVTVCKSSDGTSCAATGTWDQGWIVFDDSDNDAAVDGGETIIRVFPALEGDNTLKGSGDVASYISFVSVGSAKTTTGAFQAGSVLLCDDRGASYGRTINLSVTGRSRVETDAPDSCDP